MTKTEIKEKLEITVGADGGNSSGKIRLSNGHLGHYEMVHSRRPITQDKDYEVNNAKALKLDLNQLSDYLDVSVKLASDKRGKEVLFGKIANYKADTKTERSDSFKSSDSQLVRNTLICIADSIVVSEKLNGEEIDVDINLCTGLPVQEHQIEEKKEQYLGKYTGVHTIEFLHPAYPVRKMNINVKNNYVEIEGSAALRQEIANEKLMRESAETMNGSIYSMIDIGCFSIDAVGARFVKQMNDKGELINKLNIESDLGFGEKMGIGIAQRNTIKSMTDRYGNQMSNGEEFTRKEISDAHINNDGFIQGKLTKLGEKFCIEPNYTRELEVIGEEIADQFAELYNSRGNTSYLRKIYLCGGGSKDTTVVDALKEILDEKGINPDIVKVLEEPIFANANGYFNIARVKSKK